ncbi:single-stranded DNA-binding protein [Clostridium botulinum]|uniref:Single-stranded DNA-binding protein n=2 Tax=Clostridium TaxID=1485 RepID=A0AA44BSE3_CLOBO|nr:MULTISPECIES: single-stranded DNA-binding protein [Clostridium]AJD29385.1 single-stranded DNA-binding family protein [Clostridium botulinum Prevot_594]MCC5441073.1 single-stranded DNA-binding protein [Clostridium botulinum]NFI09722.1 single-stranded DNA-binding protein [Clostridium botulinum]NFI23440.1 single-stranded DNA-binding protein [Clostridium botulinum]NFL97955.1 single-stranded DNA-binding protein [Clostridium botulinum]
MNKVVLIGRLTKDPELKFTPGNGTAVANFTLAVDRRFSKDGQREADFIPIVVWGKQAESTANYMSKGKLMGVSGRIQTRSYEAKDGTKRYITEVIAEEVKFLEWGDKVTTDSSYNNRSESSYQSGQNFGNGNSFDDDIIPVDDGDIPF